MFAEPQTQRLNRPRVVKALKDIRCEWQDAAQGDRLTDVKVSVGYLLADVALAMGLSSQELEMALGADLLEDLLEALPRDE